MAQKCRVGKQSDKYEVAKSRDTWEEPASCWAHKTSQIHASSTENYVKRFASVSSTAWHRETAWCRETEVCTQSFNAAVRAPLLKSCWTGSEAEMAGKPQSCTHVISDAVLRPSLVPSRPWPFRSSSMLEAQFKPPGSWLHFVLLEGSNKTRSPTHT